MKFCSTFTFLHIRKNVFAYIFSARAKTNRLVMSWYLLFLHIAAVIKPMVN